jgi:hypothetical protein
VTPQASGKGIGGVRREYGRGLSVRFNDDKVVY